MQLFMFFIAWSFPSMKFGELSIIGKDKNSQNLNISIWFITIIYKYLLQFYFLFTVNM